MPIWCHRWCLRSLGLRSFFFILFSYCSSGWIISVCSSLLCPSGNFFISATVLHNSKISFDPSFPNTISVSLLIILWWDLVLISFTLPHVCPLECLWVSWWSANGYTEISLHFPGSFPGWSFCPFWLLLTPWTTWIPLHVFIALFEEFLVTFHQFFEAWLLPRDCSMCLVCLKPPLCPVDSQKLLCHMCPDFMLLIITSLFMIVGNPGRVSCVVVGWNSRWNLAVQQRHPGGPEVYVPAASLLFQWRAGVASCSRSRPSSLSQTEMETGQGNSWAVGVVRWTSVQV